METSGRRMAGSGKQYPASVVGILWGDTGRKNTVAFRGTGRTVADRYFCTVFLEYGNSGGTKRAGRAFGSFGDSDRGIVLTGGGSLIQGLEELIEEKTGINTMTAEDPLTAVAIGTGKYIEYLADDDKKSKDK